MFQRPELKHKITRELVLVAAGIRSKVLGNKIKLNVSNKISMIMCETRLEFAIRTPERVH